MNPSGYVSSNEAFVDAAGRMISFGNDGASLFLQTVPEPKSFVLAVLGLLSLGCVAWRRRGRA